ncbi:MAG: transcription elongation factor GreA [Bacteroidales bacterium]|nr:transcription elongation factor GreA [Bacteroidales bacterium]
MTYMTEEGLRKLKEKLNHLMGVERSKISQQIAEARDKGDLSENAEYDAAKEAQGLLELKISKLQKLQRSARIIDESKIDTESVQMLNTVKVKNLKFNKEFTYTIVPENESDVQQGKIAVGTPISQGLIGAKVGDVVKIKVPSGEMEFEVLDISI